MESIKCAKCGQLLNKVATLTDEECKNLIYLNSVQQTVDRCINNLGNVELDRKLKNCIRRLFAKKAEEFISRKEFIDTISKKYNVTNFEIIEGCIYVHTQTN